MKNESPKSINGLMKHLRSSGIDINGGLQKNQLSNQGYFHGYKGYRYSNKPTTPLPFKNYEEINKTIIFDANLKTLLYEKMMFLETALKSVVLQQILKDIKSAKLSDFYNEALQCFRTADPNLSDKKKEEAQNKLFNLKKTITNLVQREYNKNNPKITHFYEGHSSRLEPPLWAVFDILMLGDFGNVCESLVLSIRDEVSKKFGIPSNYDTDRTLFATFIYALKDLRNAVAHNEVVYDARFKKVSVTNGMETFIMHEESLPFFNLKDIIDYVALIVFFLKKLKVNNRDIKKFIKSVSDLIDQYFIDVGSNIASVSFHNGWKNRLSTLINYCR